MVLPSEGRSSQSNIHYHTPLPLQHLRDNANTNIMATTWGQSLYVKKKIGTATTTMPKVICHTVLASCQPTQPSLGFDMVQPSCLEDHGARSYMLPSAKTRGRLAHHDEGQKKWLVLIYCGEGEAQGIGIRLRQTNRAFSKLEWRTTGNKRVHIVAMHLGQRETHPGGTLARTRISESSSHI